MVKFEELWNLVKYTSCYFRHFVRCLSLENSSNDLAPFLLRVHVVGAGRIANELPAAHPVELRVHEIGYLMISSSGSVLHSLSSGLQWICTSLLTNFVDLEILC